MELQLDFQHEIESILNRDLTRDEIRRIEACQTDEYREDAQHLVDLLQLQ